MLTIKDVITVGDVVGQLDVGRNRTAIPTITSACVEIRLEDISAILGVSRIETAVAVFAVVHVVARTLSGIELMDEHSGRLSLELFELGADILYRFWI